MLDHFLKSLLQLDHNVWYKVNVVWQNSILDTVAPILRNPNTWIPLYIFLAIIIPYKFGKKGLLWCLGFLITFALSDYTSASIIKPMVCRVRPCNDVAVNKIMHLIVTCGSGYSFPSSHAANHFALAFFMIFSLRKTIKWIWLVAPIWAFSIAYSQVYVGVHYPLDVTCGALLGILVGFITGRFFETKISFASLPNKKRS
jgi:membrane-associated phospholipid phosphatase